MDCIVESVEKIVSLDETTIKEARIFNYQCGKKEKLSVKWEMPVEKE